MKNAVIGSTTTFARMYEVLTHAISSRGGAEVAGHLREGDVDDRGVEHFHHRGRDEAEEDEPAVGDAFFGVVRSGDSLCGHESREG